MLGVRVMGISAVNLERAHVYDKYRELFKLEGVPKYYGMRENRVTIGAFLNMFKPVKCRGLNDRKSFMVCSVCGFPLEGNSAEVHRRYHAIYDRRFDVYKPFKSLESAYKCQAKAQMLFNNTNELRVLSDSLIISAIESYILADFTEYLILNIRYMVDYMSSSLYDIDIDNVLDIISFSKYAYSWLDVNRRGLVVKDSIMLEIYNKYANIVGQYDYGTEMRA